jgi:two-component system chemotaxis response regulator CheY
LARILIIDDNVLIRTLMREILNGGGHEVVASARDGLEAPRWEHKFRPELATLDMVMPGRSGLTTLHHLRMVDPSIAIVVCSAALTDRRIREARKLGANGFIEKPFDRRTVLDVVGAVLKSLANREPPPRLPTPPTTSDEAHSERREFVRVRGRLPVFVVPEGGHQPFDTETVDIGGGGLLLAGGPLKRGTSVRFSLALGSRDGLIDGRGRVVRVTDSGQAALAFEQLSIADHERLIRFIEARYMPAAG